MSLFYVFMMRSRAVFTFLSVSLLRSSYLASHCCRQNSIVQSSHCLHQHYEITIFQKPSSQSLQKNLSLISSKPAPMNSLPYHRSSMLSLLLPTSPCSSRGLKTLKQSMPPFLRFMPFKPSFEETNHTVKLFGISRPKPKSPAPRINYTRHHMRPICSMVNSWAFVDLMCSLSVFYACHTNRFSIARSAKPKIQGSSTLPWAFMRSLSIPRNSQDLHVIPRASASSI